jgi:hypothetical protein
MVDANEMLGDTPNGLGQLIGQHDTYRDENDPGQHHNIHAKISPRPWQQ